MFNDMLDNTIRKAIEDRLEAEELVAFLRIPIEDIITYFEDEILENIIEVLEYIGLRGYDNDND
jgi:hypothetical protein